MPSRVRSCRAALRARPLQPLHGRPASAAALAACRSVTTSSPVSCQHRSRTGLPSLQPYPLPSTSFAILFATTSSSSFYSRRSYHSHDHPTPKSPFSPTERAILTAACAHIPAHGFSQAALSLGARDAGYLDISTNLLPHGLFSLVQWHLVSQREALAEKAQELFRGAEQDGQHIGVGRKVEALTWARLMGNQEVIGRWQEALAIMAQPIYVPKSLRELAKLSDEIWFLAGDVSVDPSWYTKRASLSAIYASTELFMTTDKSRDFAETNKFLRRRLEEVQDVSGSLRSLGQWVGFTAGAGLNVLRSKGIPI